MATIHLPTRAIKLSAADNQMRIPDATGRLWIVRLARSNAGASRRPFGVCLAIIRPCSQKWQAIYCSKCPYRINQVFKPSCAFSRPPPTQDSFYLLSVTKFRLRMPATSSRPSSARWRINIIVWAQVLAECSTLFKGCIRVYDLPTTPCNVSTESNRSYNACTCHPYVVNAQLKVACHLLWLDHFNDQYKLILGIA